MSWFRTIADSLGLDDDDEQHSNSNSDPEESPKPQDDAEEEEEGLSSSSPTARGVTDDLSEITKTLTDKFWGFLASPSDPSSPPDPNPLEASEEEAVIAGIRSDFAEISGRVRLGFSKLSSNINVSEISKIASNFLQIGSEEGSMERYESVGVTDEVLAFVNVIAMHPETWLDFPVPSQHDEFGEFDMTDAQQEHALAVEGRAPRLAILRMELCPTYMSDGCFWKIYFVLLHPRLDKNIALLLSTPEIMEARALLTPDLRSRTKSVPKVSGMDPADPKEAVSSAPEEPLSVQPIVQSESESLKISAEKATSPTVLTVSEIDKHAVQSTEIQVIDKSIIEEEPMKHTKHQPSSSEDENDEWLKEDISEIVSANRTTEPISKEDEDVSFSDFENEDDEEDAPASDNKDGSDSSAKDSRDWVQLGRSSTDSAKDANPADTKHVEKVSSNHENKDSSDWLDVNDIDAI